MLAPSFISPQSREHLISSQEKVEKSKFNLWSPYGSSWIPMDPYGSIHSQIYSILYLHTVLAMSLKQHIYSFKFSNADPYKSKWICKFSTSSNSSNVYTILTFCLNPISYTTHRKLSKICTYGSAFVNDPKSYQSIWVQSYL